MSLALMSEINMPPSFGRMCILIGDSQSCPSGFSSAVLDFMADAVIAFDLRPKFPPALAESLV